MKTTDLSLGENPAAARLRPRTMLLEMEGRLLCKNAETIRRHDGFYVPTMVSAVIHNNSECVREICDSSSGLYFTVRNLNLLPVHVKNPIFYGELSTFIYCRTIAASATSDPTATSGSLSACTSSAMTSSTASTKPKRRDSSPSTSSGPSRTTTTWSLARRRTIIISRWSLGTSARAPLRWKCHLPLRWPRSAW